MAQRIEKFLDQMDTIREDVNTSVDEQLKRVNIKTMLHDPEKMLKVLIADYLSNNIELLKRASKEGKKLAKSL